MSDKILAARAAKRTQVFGIVSGALIALYGLVISRDHITHVGHAIGLNDLEAKTLFIFIDFVAIYGKLLTSKRLKAKTRKIGYGFLAFGGLASLTCNVASGIIGGSFGAATYGAFIVAIVAGLEYSVANTLAEAEAVAMVAKTVADAQLATAMAKAADDMAKAVAIAVAKAEQSLRATLAKEQDDLLAEAERATREAAAKDAAIRADRERAAREQELAAQLAKAEAERVALAKQVATATATVATAPKAVAKKPVANVANVANEDEVATARVANGQASAVAMAILATDPDMAEADVIRVATEQGGVVPSGRTVRRVKGQIAAAAAA